MSRAVVKQKRAERTRRDVLDAAREIFTGRGFADASMEEIAERAGVTRGPLYHYFDDKQDLFRAVYAEVERYLAEKVLLGIRSRVGPGASAWEQVHAGNQAFLDTALEPFVQRITILDAPAVLGWDARRDFARHGLGLIRNGLQMAMDEGSMDAHPVEPLAHLLRAVLSEGALLIARAEDHAAARAEVGAAVDRLMEGLRRSEG
jgi:AcrR family transcriptional regulator